MIPPLKAILSILLGATLIAQGVADEIDIKIKQDIPGIDYPKKGEGISVKRSGVLLKGASIPLSEGSKLYDEFLKSGGFKTPMDAVLATSWLFREKRLDDLKTVFKDYLSEPAVQSHLSDASVDFYSKFLTKVKEIEGIVVLDDQTKSGVWVIYQLKTDSVSPIYIDYFLHSGGLYIPAYIDVMKDPDIYNLMRAYIHESNKGKKSVELAAKP